MYMKQNNTSAANIRKNIDLPRETVAALGKLADDSRMKVKPFIELVLIDYAKKNKKK